MSLEKPASKLEERLTRTEFVMELLTTWERWLIAAEKNNFTAMARQLKAAIHTLKTSFTAEELVDMEPYKAQIDETDSANS